MKRQKPKRSPFEHRFEGREVLQGLLELAGSPASVEEVLEAMRAAHAEGAPVQEVISALFEEEPRFPDPSYAQRLFQNLLGLWDLVVSGARIDLSAKERPPRPKKVKPTPPEPFGNEGPSEAFVEAAWRYMEDLDNRERNRFEHAFENRQDALLGLLDEQGLTDEGYACARHLLFELFSMIELGWRPGVGRASRERLLKAPGDGVPAALKAYAEEAVFEAEQDEQVPLSPDEGRKVREVVERGLAALWEARRPA